MIDDRDAWWTADEVAGAIICTVGMVRHQLRMGTFSDYARKTGGRWWIHRDALADPVVWQRCTGTNDRKTWAPAWEGTREGPRAARRRLRIGNPGLRTIALADLPVIDIDDLPVVLPVTPD